MQAERHWEKEIKDEGKEVKQKREEGEKEVGKRGKCGKGEKKKTKILIGLCK